MAYGLHPNAEIGFRTTQCNMLFNTLLELQPKDAVNVEEGVLKSNNELAYEVMKFVMEDMNLQQQMALLRTTLEKTDFVKLLKFIQLRLIQTGNTSAVEILSLAGIGKEEVKEDEETSRETFYDFEGMMSGHSFFATSHDITLTHDTQSRDFILYMIGKFIGDKGTGLPNGDQIKLFEEIFGIKLNLGGLGGLGASLMGMMK